MSTAWSSVSRHAWCRSTPARGGGAGRPSRAPGRPTRSERCGTGSVGSRDPVHVDIQHAGRLDRFQPRQKLFHAPNRRARRAGLDVMQGRVRMLVADGDQRVEAVAHRRRQTLRHALGQQGAGLVPGRPHRPAQHRVGRRENGVRREASLAPMPAATPCGRGAALRLRGTAPGVRRRRCRTCADAGTHRCAADARKPSAAGGRIEEGGIADQARAEDVGVKTVAYLRVSTPQQDVRSQRLAILEYVRANDLRIDEFIEATASGQASEKRRRLDELTSALQRGDRLVVSELSRLGRSLGQIVTILDALPKAGVAFVALKENIRVEGKRNIQTKVMTTLFALLAEVERDLISERTREGLARGPGFGPEARAPEGLAGRLTTRWQGGRDSALPRAGRLQDGHCQDHRRLPYRPLQLHEHPRPPADALACISARIWSVP